MEDLGIKPPSAPGIKPQKKEGFFSRLFNREKSLDDAKTSEDEFSGLDLEDIRKRVGLPDAPEESVQEIQEESASVNEPLGAPPMPPQLEEERIVEEDDIRFDLDTNDPAFEDSDAPSSNFADEEPAQALPNLEDLEEEHLSWELTNKPESVAEEKPVIPVSDWSAPPQEFDEPVQSEWVSTEPPVEEKPKKAPREVAAPIGEPLTDPLLEARKEVLPPPKHHEHVDEALSDIAKKHTDLDKELERLTKQIRTDIPDWKYQKKEIKAQNYFILKNGQEVTSFKDLLEALSFIDDETFEHHVTENRNDFAEWVQYILKEEKLAERIRNKKARGELLKILRSHEKKVLKEIEKETKQAGALATKKKRHVKKAEELHKKVESLQKELEKKTAQLKELRGVHGKKIKKKLDEHVDDRIGEARKQLHMAQEEVDKKGSELSDRESTIWEREQALQVSEKNLADAQKRLEKEKQDVAAKASAAQKLIEESKEIATMKAAAQKARKEAKQLLDKEKKAATQARKAERQAKKAQEQLAKKQKKFDTESKQVKDLKKELDAREKEFVKREKELAKMTTDAQKTSKQADEWHARAKRERDEWHALKKKETAKLEEHRKEIEGMLKELEKKKVDYEELVEKHESNLKRNEEVLNETQELRDEIKQRQEAFESKSMREYLQSRLNSTITGEITTSETVPDIDDISNVHLYKLIDQCKAALDKNELQKARQVYNKLRDEFSHTKLSSHEKSVLYNSIRELYDDIHLAMLNQ